MKALVLRNDDGVPSWTEAEFNEGNSLEFLQSQVDGFVERVPYFDALENNNIDVWVNEEGKVMGLPVTMIVSDAYGQPVDAICGNLVFTRVDEEGRTIGLTDDDIQLVRNHFTL